MQNTTITVGTKVRVWNNLVTREYGTVVDVCGRYFDVKLESGKTVTTLFDDLRTTESLH
ncbi:hypothetical protein AB0G00_24050 [Nocardia salmonicida]|uniref:hypothetical protein n=1 Tax=Nocardia salmonicida TaxID=53431 RepID=UPI003400B358